MMIGETKLGYKVTELVGQGGFGTVYKAVKKNKAMETVRALKHISLPSRKEWTDIYNSMGNDMARTDAYFDTILQEILNEIRILADLTNKGVKNVVWYYENEIEDTPSPKHYDIYLLMEFLTPFTTFIETHQVKVKDVLKVGTDILSALVECHKRKIIHRDIKTDNIFISEDGDYKLGDFGVSKKLSDRSRATSMKGTPNFIAPEVYLGQEYDETVDLYSLGIVLYRLLNYNRNPFMPDYPTSYNSEDEDKAFELRMKGDTPNYPAFAQGDLGNVILKSIADKENRYKTAKEFKTALESVMGSLSEEELETVVLENQLSNVDFSTFGSRNDMTQMANDNQPSVANNSFQNSQSNSFSMNASSSFSNNNQDMGKKKFILPASIAAVVIIGAVLFFILNGKKSTDQKFVQVDGFTKYIKDDGNYAQNEWIIYKGDEYYFNGRQSLVTNDSIEVDGKTYYVDSDGKKIINGWYKTSDGKEYYLNEKGEPFKNTAKTINNEVCFFDEKGEKVTNDWCSYDGDYYFVDNDGKMLKNQFKNTGIDWYYLGGDGKMLKNTFYDDNGQTYYFDSDGKMKKNTMFIVDSSLYFSQTDGTIKKNGWCANNLYYADGEGKILVNTTTPDGVKVDGTGKRIQESTSYNGSSQSSQASQKETQKQTSQKTTGSIKTTATDKLTDDGTAIIAGTVNWGDHIRYTDTYDLEDFGRDGEIGKININVMKLKDDGSAEVAEVNRVVKEIFDEVVDRSEYEKPYKLFELAKSTVTTCNDSVVILNFQGEIKYDESTTDKMKYKLTLDRTTRNATYQKVN